MRSFKDADLLQVRDMYLLEDLSTHLLFVIKVTIPGLAYICLAGLVVAVSLLHPEKAR